jgi:hypothetical protein
MEQISLLLVGLNGHGGMLLPVSVHHEVVWPPRNERQGRGCPQIVTESVALQKGQEIAEAIFAWIEVVVVFHNDLVN